MYQTDTQSWPTETNPKLISWGFLPFIYTGDANTHTMFYLSHLLTVNIHDTDAHDAGDDK